MQLFGGVAEWMDEVSRHSEKGSQQKLYNLPKLVDSVNLVKKIKHDVFRSFLYVFGGLTQ